MIETISYLALGGFGAILAFAGAFFLFALGISAYSLFKAPAGTPAVSALPRRLQEAKSSLRQARARAR